jgi:23S rRNA (uracil1939-C5)-methyltransferase
MKDLLDGAFLETHGRPDVVITDPPRAGMHEDVCNVLLQAAPQRIVYVSCNPATQARDLKILSAKYDITAVQPVDMFPQTVHVENVVRLDLQSALAKSKADDPSKDKSSRKGAKSP